LNSPIKARELTLRVILIALGLTVILAMSNAYLALKLGLLTSASIPAAIISMGILKFFKNANILENNLVQTAASAGEAVAGGIVYTIPALIIIHYWHGFDYWTNFSIALLGGVLGVLFSIPLRKLLVHDPLLKFPEGVAIAEVLKTSANQGGLKEILTGGLIGATLEFLQLGLKVIASSYQHWFMVGRAVFGIGAGFSATMIGAGFLIGHEMAISIMLGAVFAWVIALPIVSMSYAPLDLTHGLPEAAGLLWNAKLRYIGIGAMLFAGVWTFLRLFKPLVKNIYLSLKVMTASRDASALPNHERDMPMPIIIVGVLLSGVALFTLFNTQFPLDVFQGGRAWNGMLLMTMVGYVIVIGFLFSVITAYFSGMVGVTASPGSSIVIAGLLLVAWILLRFITTVVGEVWTPEVTKAAEAITIIIGSVVTGIAAIANDNTQDLKVGQLVGATPWKQQLMLLMGVVVSALVIPPVMQVLFNVYGIADVTPRVGMDLTQTLPAPTAALMAAITEAVFRHTLPWHMLMTGCGIIVGVLGLNLILKRWFTQFNLSILGVAIGMYLPLATSTPLLVGGLIAFSIRQHFKRSTLELSAIKQRKQIGVLIACGLVAGSALMDVLLAIPFSLLHSPEALSIVSPQWQNRAVILGIISVLSLAFWMHHRVKRS